MAALSCWSTWPTSSSRTASVVSRLSRTAAAATRASTRSSSLRARVPGPAAGATTSVIGARSARRTQHVARAPHGVDHRRPVRVDLLAQVGDVELDDVGLPAEVVVPHPVQDLGFAEHPARVAHQIAEQLELGGGQRDLLAAPGNLVAVLVQGQVAD